MNRADRRALKRRGIAQKMRASQTGRRLLDETPSRGTVPRVPDDIRAEVEKTERNTAPGKLPVTVIARRGEPAGEALVIVKFSSWLRHVGQQIQGIAAGSEAGEEGEG